MQVCYHGMGVKAPSDLLKFAAIVISNLIKLFQTLIKAQIDPIVKLPCSGIQKENDINFCIEVFELLLQYARVKCFC